MSYGAMAPAVPAMASGPYSLTIALTRSPISSIASSHETRAHLPSPRLPTLFSG